MPDDMIPTRTPCALADLLARHGDRTSSAASLGDAFLDFPVPESVHAGGVIRHQATPRAWVAAAEPLCPPALRAAALDAFARAAPRGRAVAMPLRPELGRELAARGWRVWTTGAEPIFDLGRLFAPGSDPLREHRIALALRHRGGQVREVDVSDPRDPDQSRLRKAMTGLATAWLDAKPLPPMGFLSQILPLDPPWPVRHFLLTIRDEPQGYVAAVPVQRDGRILAWHLADVIRHPQARAGSRELLVLETMRLLHESGALEARLGKAALAHLPAEGPGVGVLGWLHRHWTAGYAFQALAASKEKFGPDRWEPLCMAATGMGLAGALREVVAVHLPGGFLPAAARWSSRTWAAGMRLLPDVPARLGLASGLDRAPRNLADFFHKTRWTTALVCLFTLIHLLRPALPWLEALQARSAYVPGAVTWEGLLLGPFFHNHLFHLWGDQLSFYLAGAMLEILLGARAMLLLTAAGLWLSNPLTQALCFALLKPFFPDAWEQVLAERDYGSSNAVFALIGCYGGLLRKRAWLLGPFFVYGVVICLARESWLSLHHLVTLGLGWLASWLWLWYGGRSSRHLDP